MSEVENPRAIVGSNNPPLARSIAAEDGDFALVTTAFLQEEYAKQPQIVEALLAEARAIPKTIEDEATKGKTTSIIKRLRDAAKAIDAFHSKEKQPYLRGGQAVDQFFFGLIDKCARRAKGNNPGAADVLNVRLTDYDNRVLAAEQARRKREADEQARLARVAQEEADRAAQVAEDARLAAERARKPETAEQKGAVATEKEAVADQAKVDATVSSARAEEAHISTLARPADIMRVRGDDGTLSTMGTEKYAEIVDRTLLSKELLWPYIKQEALESALAQWAKFTDYGQQMPGAAIGRRNKSVVR